VRILVVTNMYPTEAEPWFGSFVRDQVEDLRGLGIDLRVFSFDGRRHARRYVLAAREVGRLVVEERFDVVHAHYGLTGAAASFQRRVPVVTTFHGSDYTGAIRWQWAVSWVVSRCSLPIVVSDAGRRALGRPHAPVIPSGVDTERFRPIERSLARRRLGWDEGPHYVLLPGMRSRAAKGAGLFDAALSETRKVAADVRPVSLDGLSRNEVALAFNAVDVTLMTSEREGSPLTVRESLACLTPVVSVDVGDVAQVIANLPACGVFPRAPVALAQGVLEALSAERHPSLRKRAELTSRRRVAERLAALYASTAERTPA
jgi:glycosyltransferase involved in cell wall biosynthesis